MSFRTVVISSRSKLDLSLNRMVVRDCREKKYVFMDDIDILIIENPAVSITGCLLSALVDKKVKVIFCNSRHSPQAELTAYYGCVDGSRKLKAQLSWNRDTASILWASIVANGCLTQLGIAHDNTYNLYNLSCDFIEPFRILVDRFVRKSDFKDFGTEEKHKLLHFLEEKVTISGVKHTIPNALRIYVKSLCDALNKDDLSFVQFYTL